MAIQILSDLHLETPTAYDLFDIPPQAPYLALLGDIGNIVFFLLGNHEPYHSNWPTVRTRINEFSDAVIKRRPENLGEFVFLDQARYDLSPDITVLGCTLYSQVTKPQEERVSFGINDFYHIQDWTVENHSATHQADLAWLNNQVSEIVQKDPRRKAVVFTHHSPIAGDPRASDPAHANSPISSAFATDLTDAVCWKAEQVCVWAFGHTHYNCDFVEERTGTRVVANQRGYYFSQASGFDLDKAISM